MSRSPKLFFSAVLVATAVSCAGELYQVGVAKIDVTPAYPVRLAGYAARKTESEGVAQHLYAKALAIGSDKQGPALLLTIENCGLPLELRQEIATRLARRAQLAANRIALCATHTHSAPCLTGYLRNLFGGPLPPDQQERIDRYTRELTDQLEKVALAALADRRPAQLSYARGTAGFAANRRTPGGPTDHDLPALFITNPGGKLRAVLISYACHGTTLTGEFNQICGDWPGYAAEAIEREFPGALALITLGCAGDQNPNPRPGFELARRHGAEIASGLTSVFEQRTPIQGKLVCRTRTISLPFDTLPARAEWEARAKETNYTGSHARLNLARLERGEKLPIQVDYMLQTWMFGKDLAMVFLPGEVVVDYSLRLKREFDPSRLWINAYANEVPCYIPSERVLKEGGYEGGGAMVYYDLPTRFAPGLEDKIIAAVHGLLPRSFRAPVSNARLMSEPRPVSPQVFLATLPLSTD